MKRVTRSITATLLSLSFLILPLPEAMACAPDLAYAILVNGNHPDLPLKLFAGGNIGIVQPGWAKSYLVVAYRYLSGNPLSATEKDSIVQLWHQRIKNGSRFSTGIFVDQKDAYLNLRAKAIGADPKKNPEIYWKMDSFSYDKGIGDSAFVLARVTLSSLLKKYGTRSQQAREWVKAQDGILGVAGQSIIVPAALAKSADPALQDDRNYQIAAANFYLRNYDKAASNFQQLANKPASPLSQIASYMVLRSKVAQLLKGDGSGDADAVAALLQKAADKADKVSTRNDILDLLRPISYLNQSAADVTKTLATIVCDGKSKRFGGDVGDLTFLLDGNAPLSGLAVEGSTGTSDSTRSDEAKKDDASAGKPAETNKSDTKSSDNVLSKSHDIADWILTVQKSSYLSWADSDDDKARAKQANLDSAKHALEMWRKTGSVPWLVAALSGTGLRLEENKDLFKAALNISSTSPAYLTCKFYVIDSLIAAGKREEARKQLSAILSISSLPPSSRNLFLTQRAAASDSILEYLKYAVLNPPELLHSTSDLVSPKFYKLESAGTFQTETPAFDTAMAADMSRNAPLSTWMAFAQSQALSPQFKPVFLRTAWTRAQLLERYTDAEKIDSALAASTPSLASALAKIKSAAAGPARQFAIACLVLRNYGMSPYMRGGAERHGAAISEFDFYNNNFWVPLPVQEEKPDPENSYSYNDTVGYSGSDELRDKMKGYWLPGLCRFLSKSEKKAAESERLELLKNHPSRFFGQAVLDWAKSHPSDSDVPEMLYRVVKLPKWTEVTAVGSEFSKKAYFVLHNKYPGNQWTKKAVCYY